MNSVFSFFLQIFDFSLTKEEIAVIQSFDRNWKAFPIDMTMVLGVLCFNNFNQISVFRNLFIKRSKNKNLLFGTEIMFQCIKDVCLLFVCVYILKFQAYSI